MALKCSYCGEEVEGEPIRKGDNIYCSEASAFEAGRSTGCDDRADSTVAVRGAGLAGKRRGVEHAEGFSFADVSCGALTNRTDMMRQQTRVVDGSENAKPGEPCAVIPQVEAIDEVDDSDLRRRACSDRLALRVTTSAMEPIHRRDRPEPYPVLSPRRRAPAAGSGGARATSQGRRQGQRSSAVNYMLAPQ